MLKAFLRQSKSDKIRGFSLVELAIVMIVSAIVVVSVMQAYRVYINDKRFKETFEKQSTIVSALGTFYGQNLRYPCPARPDLSIDDELAGVEDCTLAQVPGARDTAVDNEDPAQPDPTLIGAVPFKTLRQGLGNNQTLKSISADSTLDPWGFQMTYAVTASQTVANTFRAAYGAIAVETEGGDSLVVPANSAQLVIVAHGENRLGAYNRAGTISFPCGGVTTDAENCDGDSRFISGLHGLGNGAAYYDDVIHYQAYTLSQLWGTSPVNSNNIYNLNDGGVGIGTSNPDQRLHVVGNIKAQDGKAAEICDPVGEACWTPDMLGGPEGVGMSCKGVATPPGFFRVVTGIEFGDVVCSDPLPLPAGLAGKACAVPGQYMLGVTTAGDVICGVP
jgi:type II secretory pathway pseudopilin PulG